MSDDNEEDTKKYAKKTQWIKSDGKTAIQLNSYPATIKAAEGKGWKRK